MFDASAIKAKGLAEADAIKARANALAENQDAVISQQIAQSLPEIIAEGAKAFGSIGQLTVLNGAAGVSEFFSQMLGMGVAAVPMLKQALSEGLNGAQSSQGKRGASAGTSAEPAQPAKKTPS